MPDKAQGKTTRSRHDDRRSDRGTTSHHPGKREECGMGETGRNLEVGNKVGTTCQPKGGG